MLSLRASKPQWRYFCLEAVDNCLTLLRGTADKTALLFRLNALNVPDCIIVVALMSAVTI